MQPTPLFALRAAASRAARTARRAWDYWMQMQSSLSTANLTLRHAHASRCARKATRAAHRYEQAQFAAQYEAQRCHLSHFAR